jgi:putative methyltransferase
MQSLFRSLFNDFDVRITATIAFEMVCHACWVDLPKYARVNLLKSDVSLVIAAFKEDGYLLCDERCGALEHNNFSIDPILPDVLKFHPLAPLTTHPLYRGSHIILQDKASCLPAYLLAPPPGSNVVDCCAAPGNKTTQLASIMRNKG